MERGAELSLGPAEAVAVTVASIPVLAAAFAASALLAGRLHPELAGLSAGQVAGPFLAGIAAALVLHEVAHAAGFRLLGARPRLALRLRGGLPFISVGAPGHAFGRTAFVGVALAPLVILDGAGLALLLVHGAWPAGVAVVAVNSAGAVGDLWLCARLLLQPPGTRWEADAGRFYAWTGTRSS